jgi:DNA-nicking Smr family endonuclease
MPYPLLNDDGRRVTLDLHGLSVQEAVRLARRTVREARARGRSTVRIIHGSSTSTAATAMQTIRGEVHSLLDGGGFEDDVVHAYREADSVLLSLPLAAEVNPVPLRLRDLL